MKRVQGDKLWFVQQAQLREDSKKIWVKESEKRYQVYKKGRVKGDTS